MQVQKRGKAMSLSLTKNINLTMLLESKPMVPRERLLQVLSDECGKFIDDNILSVHMSRIRKKVEAEHIRAMQRVWYQWSGI